MTETESVTPSRDTSLNGGNAALDSAQARILPERDEPVRCEHCGAAAGRLSWALKHTSPRIEVRAGRLGVVSWPGQALPVPSRESVRAGMLLDNGGEPAGSEHAVRPKSEEPLGAALRELIGIDLDDDDTVIAFTRRHGVLGIFTPILLDPLPGQSCFGFPGVPGFDHLVAPALAERRRELAVKAEAETIAEFRWGAQCVRDMATGWQIASGQIAADAAVWVAPCWNENLPAAIRWSHWASAEEVLSRGVESGLAPLGATLPWLDQEAGAQGSDELRSRGGGGELPLYCALCLELFNQAAEQVRSRTGEELPAGAEDLIGLCDPCHEARRLDPAPPQGSRSARPALPVAEAATSLVRVEPDAPHQIERLAGIGAAWKLIGQIGVQGIRLVTIAILARLLTPADYGAAAIAIALATFAPTVGDVGMGSALVQTRTATRLVRSTAFWASLAFGIGLSVLLAVSAGPVGQFLDDPRIGTMVAAGGVTLAIFAVGSTSQAMFMREMKFRSIELRYWFAIVLASAVAIIAAGAGAGPWALVLQQIALLTAFVAALWWRAGWRPTLDFSGPVFRELGSFAIRIAGGRWARLIELLVLFLLIGKLAGVPALGAWTFAMSTVILPLTVIAIPIAEVLFSAFSRLRGERDRIAALWLESIRFLAAVILPLLVGLVVVAPDLIPIVFGSQWRVSVAIIQILSIYVIIRSLQAWSSVLMDAVGRPQVTLWTQLAALCLTPIAVVIGAEWSIEGVAICFVIGQLIAVEVPMLIIVLSELRVSLRTVTARLASVAAATLVMGITCLLGRSALSALGIGAAGRVALTIALGVFVYAVALWWLAPDIGRRIAGLGRSARAKLTGAGRRPVPQP